MPSASAVSTTPPGDGKPGLWMHLISRIGAVYSLVTRKEEIFMEQKRRGELVMDREDEDIELVIPPVFEGCTRILGLQEQIEARDLYWEAVCESTHKGAEDLLLGCIERNPFIGDPHVVLAQVYLGRGRFEEAEREGERGLKLLLEWGSPWARVLHMKAKERSWPETAWGIFGLGTLRHRSNS